MTSCAKQLSRCKKRRDSLVVTHPTTNLPACGLSTAERTGSPVLHTLWSYVFDIMLWVERDDRLHNEHPDGFTSFGVPAKGEKDMLAGVVVSLHAQMSRMDHLKKKDLVGSLTMQNGQLFFATLLVRIGADKGRKQYEETGLSDNYPQSPKWNTPAMVEASSIMATPSSPESLPEEPCSICLDLISDKRIFGYIRNDPDSRLPDFTLEDCDSIFHKRRPSCARYEESLCKSCAHLRIECLEQISVNNFDKSWPTYPNPHNEFRYDWNIAIVLDRIWEIQARKESCFLCARITELLTLEGGTDISQVVHVDVQLDKHDHIYLSVREQGQKYPCARLYGNFDSSTEAKMPDFTTEYSVSEIDWLTVKKWIEESLESAQKSSKSIGLCKPPDGFRLIDIRELCVVLAPTPCEYACLSYVWGTNTSCQATSENISDLEQSRSLERDDLPQTIRDAIEVCSNLGSRYLWVDRLCIIQNEESSSKKTQIDAMCDIYRGGLFTIVALEGSHSGHGLHGVSPELGRSRYPRFRIGDQLFEAFPDSFDGSCNRSKWQTRGWTCQERIMSPRLLFFTKNGLYYQSETDPEIKTDIQEWAAGIRHRGGNAKYFDYPLLVAEISNRQFSVEEDIVNGLAGALDFFVGKGNHQFSMSLIHFDEAITWRVYGQSRGRTVFPSWSWVSVKESPEFESESKLLPIASWAVIDSATVSELRWLKAGNEIPLEEEAIVTGTFLWRHGCMRSEFPHEFRSLMGRDEYMQLFRYRFPTNKAFNEACGVWPGGEQKNSELLEKFTQQQIEAGGQPMSILAHSQTIVLPLVGRPDQPVRFMFQYEGLFFGYMAFDPRSKHYTALEAVKPCTRITGVEFLALSASWYSNWNLCYYYRDDKGYLKPVDKLDQLSGRKPTDLPFYPTKNNEAILEEIHVNVLAIRTTNDGISHRLGSGFIPLIVWLTILKPTFKSIVLQ
ncbi:HET-domain-containing protein [Aspergillus heteromorphus CBS 117.55]|uniref:HET-domain-containing protein n=1 Tax=Aspergillus heteromorphus CBS 117.55 TaxID=1448321 RepID=A0A317WJQ9_9EURO|nr:HET-domain-containing protein [Aspergillus heteromorphus CBS 117.55]PWY86684.1 HET-domain-containing protein [Aspergillus heteromorphus CBS 117.55]